MAGAERIILCGGAPGPSSASEGDLLALDLDRNNGNVNLRIENLTRPLAANLPDVLVDLIEIAAYVYSADQAITRGGDGVVTVGRNWRRNLTFHVPVRELEVWSSPAVAECLRDTLSFLSDDQYDFQFRAHSNAAPIQQYLCLDESAQLGSDLDEVLLFSGGLDSLAGAVVAAVRERRRVALVSHRSNTKIHSKQKQLVRELDHVSAHKAFHIPVWVNKDGALSKEHTQRTRSFLFASLGFAVARAHGLDRLRFYENGIVSLNLPISEQVVGGRATRTTHPQVLNGFARLFGALIQSSFVVENPFLWLTKGEIVNVIGDGGCAELIKDSVSCTHTMDQTKLHTHCGRCSQCVSRRFATLASKYGDHDPAEMYKVDLLEGEREDGVDLTLLESFIRAATDWKTKNEFQLWARYGEATRILRHVEPLRPSVVAKRIVHLHQKHAEEVTGVLEKAMASRSGQILEEKLSPNCAIILALPAGYRSSRQSEDSPSSLTHPRSVGHRERNRAGPYSNADDAIYRLVGESGFQTLTNEEIGNRHRTALRLLWKKHGRRNKVTPDALRSCLNRIRRRHELPRSEDIKKRSGASGKKAVKK